jgi:lipopolysaccharide/colanic/teichoic acid biosynthesis glycosyltransferase
LRTAVPVRHDEAGGLSEVWRSIQRTADLKRALDVVLSAAAIALLSPVLIVISIGIRIRMGKPVFFTQIRPGKNGIPFRIIKFRTMEAPGPQEAWHLTDDLRTTPFGKALRSFSLDELPELFNVLKGDMSLVGPRPLAMEYLDNYTKRQARRHEMRPGMTGWAQVHGRRNLLMSERLELDVWYVDNWSLLLDIRILLQTIPTLIRERGDIAGQTLDDVDDLGLWPGSRQPPSRDRPSEDP